MMTDNLSSKDKEDEVEDGDGEDGEDGDDGDGDAMDESASEVDEGPEAATLHFVSEMKNPRSVQVISYSPLFLRVKMMLFTPHRLLSSSSWLSSYPRALS